MASQSDKSIDTMASSQPLIETKGGHSKASIFYGADEYLEELKNLTCTHQKDLPLNGMLMHVVSNFRSKDWKLTVIGEVIF